MISFFLSHIWGFLTMGLCAVGATGLKIAAEAYAGQETTEERVKSTLG